MNKNEDRRKDGEHTGRDTGEFEDEPEVIRLSEKGAEAFIRALENSGEPGEGLKSLNRKARRIPGGAWSK